MKSKLQIEVGCFYHAKFLSANSPLDLYEFKIIEKVKAGNKFVFIGVKSYHGRIMRCSTLAWFNEKGKTEGCDPVLNGDQAFFLIEKNEPRKKVQS